MFPYLCKRFLCLALASVAAFVCLVSVYASRACKLSLLQGERTFYLCSPSSQAVQTKTPAFFELTHVHGESVVLEIPAEAWRGDTDAFAWEIGGRYGASYLFCEKARDVTSYYFYAPALYTGVVINGQCVNLHVAVSTTQCTVGSPLIFGGF